MLQYIENKRKRDLLKHSESMQTGPLNPDATAGSPEPNKTGMGSVWKQGRTERMFYSSKRPSVFNQSRISGFSPNIEDDYELEIKLEKFQEKIRNAEERYETEQKRIRDTCLNHSMHVDRTKNLYD